MYGQGDYAPEPVEARLTSAPRMRGVPLELDSLRAVIERLEKELAMMEETLGPVLAASENVPTPSNVDPSPGAGSTVGANIRECNEKLDRIAYRIQALRQRVDV